jgi:hypothetical protein
MSPDEWRAASAARRAKINEKKSAQVTGLRLVPARHTSPDALTGNGLNEPDQGAGKEESEGADRNTQVEHTTRPSDTYQTDNDNLPATDGAGAPSRHAAVDEVQRLEQQLEDAKRRAAQVTGIESLTNRIKTANLSPDQIDGLHVYLDDLQKKNLYSEAQLDSVASGSVESVEEVTVSDEDIAAYLDRPERTE